VLAHQETTVSLRWVIPFVRVTGASPDALPILLREGIELKDFAHPDTRIRHRAVMELLEAAIRRTGDPLLGLRAGELIEAADFETLGYACQSCADLREAIGCAGRYMYLMHGAQQTRLVESGDQAVWELRITDNVPQLPAANDFALASACWLTRRYTSARTNVLREVHFLHAEPTDLVAYERVFEGAKIRMGMPHNALVFDRAFLSEPMVLAHPGLKSAFELQAEQLLDRLLRSQSVSGRVRKLIVQYVATGDVKMSVLARRMAMSVATLRRRLADEGTSHSGLLDEVRNELAHLYLADRQLAITEVAFLLGFAHVTAFYKAFARWTSGRTPADVRKEVQRR
jgi:AraC-like DNA-binding protein